MGSSIRFNRLGLACALFFVWATSQRAAGQGFHGIEIGKSCTPNRCVGDTTDCLINVSYGDDFNDTVEIVNTWDVIDPLGSNVRVPPAGNLPIVAVSGNTTCTVGGSLPCLICAGGGFTCGGMPPVSDDPGTVTFRSNGYVIQPGDPDPLPNQANVRIQDRCDGCGSPPPCPGCSTVFNTVQFTASTDLLECEDDNPCTENVCAAGQCSYPPECELDSECNDFNNCTVDFCSAQGCCETLPGCQTDSDCYDGVACTRDDCVNGCCENRRVVCPPDPNPCNSRLCNEATGLCDITRVGCNDDNPCTQDRCTAGGCVNERVACCNLDCPPLTKAKFDIWNEDERRFSGTERCIPSWDQTLLSNYTNGTGRNHFLRAFFQTNRGKARIDGIESTVCGGVNASVNVPLLGVAARELVFGNGQRAFASSELVGMGQEDGLILYDLGGPPPPPATWGGRTHDRVQKASRLPVDPVRAAQQSVVAGDPEEPPVPDLLKGRSSVSQKGSLLAFIKIEVRWNAAGALFQDTFVELTNDYFEPVRVQTYLVHGDECEWVDHALTLTPNQPMYWSALTGLPSGMTPLTIFGDPCPDDDPFNPGGTRLRGYLLAWAINEGSGAEIHWNHLSGSATIVNYAATEAWEYAPWAFQAVVDVPNGEPLLMPYGLLELDDVEYQPAPDQLLLDFFASGASFTNGSVMFGIDTDLTLWAAYKDLRQDPGAQ